MAFIWGKFHKRYLSHHSLKLAWKLHYLPKINLKSPRGQCVNHHSQWKACHDQTDQPPTMHNNGVVFYFFAHPVDSHLASHMLEWYFFFSNGIYSQGLKLSLIPRSDFLLLLSKSWSKSDRHRSYFLSLKPDIWLDWVAKLCSRFDNLGAQFGSILPLRSP